MEIKDQIKLIEAQQTAKEVAGKAIGKQGLFYIALIVVIGVISSLYLDKDVIAAVMGLLGSSLVALISMLNGIAGANPKQDKPEFEIIKQLVERLDRLADKEPMTVNVDGDKVTVKKGESETTMTKG